MLYTVYEGNESKLQELLKEANVGDLIEYITNNQMGYKKYIVEIDENKEKYLKTIEDYDSFMY
jgi:hypothetical protein